jgi:beta-galactosidase/beta-glucuronidase
VAVGVGVGGVEIGGAGVGAGAQTTLLSPARQPPAADRSVSSQRLYLSGTGPDEARGWEFRIDRGRGARQWRVIPVPSNWELQGFGSYTHGKQWWRPAEEAVYRTQFLAPPHFNGWRVELVFEGVMTDTEVLLNGRPAGGVHRGGFTRFAYDVSTMLWFHRPNLLEVRVAEASAEESVNRAEREADYWTFGGIYRPVYLEAHPPASITHVAVDARHDGQLTVEVDAVGLVAAEVRVQVESLEGEPVGDALNTPLATEGSTTIEGRLAGVEPWSAESPNPARSTDRLSHGATAARQGPLRQRQAGTSQRGEPSLALAGERPVGAGGGQPPRCRADPVDEHERRAHRSQSARLRLSRGL